MPRLGGTGPWAGSEPRPHGRRAPLPPLLRAVAATTVAWLVAGVVVILILIGVGNGTIR